MIDYVYLEQQIEFFLVAKRELHTRIELGAYFYLCLRESIERIETVPKPTKWQKFFSYLRTNPSNLHIFVFPVEKIFPRNL